jgi:uncharacterized protein YbjT (DUF2867 family)
MTEHPTTSPTTLVLGASGRIGGRVAPRLAARDIRIRRGSRSATPPFEWDDPATWPAVVRGIDHAFVSYQPDLAFPGAAERVRSFTELAVSAGVRRLVLLSGRNEEGALRAEDAVRTSGVEWTVVRSSFFAQNFSESLFVDGVRRGVLAFPGGDVAEPFVDAEDVADVVVAALTGSVPACRVYEVTGPRLLTFAEAVAEIADASGRPVTYLPISGADLAAALVEEGLPQVEVENLTDLFTAVLDGRNAYVTSGVEDALGKAPRDFSDYARAAAATGVWDAEPVATPR